MSCWSGFWFFVSCHSVMAFPSFTIRRAGAGMLSFHFPRVSNSQWPAMPLSWSCCMSSLQHGVLATQNVLTLWVSPDATGPISTFSEFPSGPHGRAVSRQHIYFHIHTGIYICTQLQMWAKNIWRYFQMQCFYINFCFITFLYLGKHSLSLNVKKKKRKHSMCPSYFFQSGRSTWVLW